MKINDMSSFRKWFKDDKKIRRNELYDENFMGVSHDDYIGLFGMYHGEKDDIEGFLRKEVEMAEDGQAIYEFVQNAADSNSTHFYMFFNDEYFIAINNGEQFTKEGIKSILNIGQSHGKTDPDKIGHYGIGFKLVHRLVGKSSGLDEILNKDKKGHRGPILFSWSDKKDIESFLSSSSCSLMKMDEKSPWLLKILLTNFPAIPGEKVKDEGYRECVPFPISEKKEFQDYLNSIKSKINFDALDKGSIFFIKLGEGKSEYLSKQEEEYTQGLSSSMHFLKSLEVININGKEVIKDEESKGSIEFVTKNATDEFNEIGLTEERAKEGDIKFKVIYGKSIEGALEMQNHPNIYKYFPAVKEANKLSLNLHSNVFALTSNRQNLQETVENKKLLTLLSSHMINKLEENKNSNKQEFLDIFISIVLSDDLNTHTGSSWQKEYFIEELMGYARLNIPTDKDNFNTNDDVLIKETKLDISPNDFGISKEWLLWGDKKDKKLTDQIKDKLKVEKYSLTKLLEKGDLETINKWLSAVSEESYKIFLKELKKSDKKPYNINEVKFIKSHDDNFYSLNEIFYHSKLSKSENYDALSNAIETLTGYKTPIEDILDDLGELDIKDEDLFDYLEDGELDDEDAKSIIEFAKEIGSSSFFKGAYFEQKESILKYQKSSQIKQYYFNKVELNNFIKEHFSSSLCLLPDSLKKYNDDDKYILKKDELYELLVANIEKENIEELIGFLPKEKVAGLMAQIENIHFSFKDKYTNDDFEYMLLDKMNVENIEELRSKLIIDDKFSLKEALGKSELEVKIDKDTYRLKLKEILPESYYYDNANKVSKISKSLKKAGISESKLDKLFNLEELTDDDYHQIKDELLDKEESVLKNASQLAYILLYNKNIKYLNLSNIYITSLDGEDISINSTFYKEDLSFINNDHILDKKRYGNIDKLLKLTKDNLVFESWPKRKVLIKPFFDIENEEFVCDGIKTDLDSSEKKVLFDYIYEYWKESKQNRSTIKAIDWAYLGQSHTVDIIGFEPQKIVLGDVKLLREDEEAPKWLADWANEEKKEFLRDLKIITSLDEVYKLREAIVKNREFKIANIDEELLAHTLDWIVEKEIEMKSESYNIAQNIADRLEIEFEEYIDEEKLKKDSKPFEKVFKNDYYKNWSEEFGFEIYFYDGEIPRECFYKEYKLKEYQEGEQKLIGNIAYLNQNAFQEEADLKDIDLEDKDVEKKLIAYRIEGVDKENKELKAKVEKLEVNKNTDESSDEFLDSNADDDMKKAASEEARKIAKEELPSKGYDCSNWDDDNIPPTIVKGVKFKGEDITLVVKSAKAGKLYLNPTEWIQLGKGSTHLVFLVSHNEIKIIDESIKKQMKKVNETFVIKLDSDQLSMENIDELSEIFKYLKGANFIFDAPGYSHSKSLEDTGIKNEGKITPVLVGDF